MPTNASDYAVSCLETLLDAAASDDLTQSGDGAGKRYRSSQKRKQQIAVITLGDDQTVPKNYLTIAADQGRLIGVYDPRAETQTPAEAESELMARGRPYLIPIVQQILANVKPRTAQEILEICIA